VIVALLLVFAALGLLLLVRDAYRK